MLRKALCLLSLLIIPAFVNGQIILTDKSVTQEQVDEAAKKLQQLKLAQKNDTLMEVGTFELIKREDTVKGDLLLQFTNFSKQTVTYGTSSILVIHDEPANTPVRIHMRRAGDAKSKLHVFPAQPTPWTWVEAVSDGTETLSALASSDAGKMPVVVSNNRIIVGNPKPVDPPPNVDPPIVDPVKFTGQRVIFVYEKDDC
jgi:hypothetical protein